MTLLYVGDLVKVRQDGVERVGRVESFEPTPCRHVGVNLGAGVEAIPVADIVEVLESVGPRKVERASGPSEVSCPPSPLAAERIEHMRRTPQ